MDKFDRIQHLHRLFSDHRYPLTAETLAEKMECSEKTVQRHITFLRDRLNAPIVSNHLGYAYEPGKHYELPGIWLTGQELQALILLLELLKSFGPGFLSESLSWIEKRIRQFLKSQNLTLNDLRTHFKILPLGNRQVVGPVFETVCAALIQNRRILLHYIDYHQKHSERELSPMRLVLYRDNWFLYAWCHHRKEMRTFSIARMQQVQLLEQLGQPVDVAILDAHFASGYGLFTGPEIHIARLRFSADLAHDISRQHWHADQQGEWQGQEYVLSFPYAKDTELITDILRFVPNIYVEAPDSLREAVCARLDAGLKRMQSPMP